MLPLNKLTKEEVGIVVYGWRCRMEEAAKLAIMYQTKLRLLEQAQDELDESEELLQTVESLPAGDRSRPALLNVAQIQLRQARGGLESARQSHSEQALFFTDAVGHEATVIMMRVIDEEDGHATRGQLQEALAAEVPEGAIAA